MVLLARTQQYLYKTEVKISQMNAIRDGNLD